MTPGALPGLFAAIKDQAATAAAPAADGMAEAFDKDVGRTLRLHAHAPMPSGAPHKRAYGIFYKATPGVPPAFASGDLAASMIRRPASGGIVATAMVGNTAIYSAVQEFGLDTWTSSAYMTWRNNQGWWRKKLVHQNEHSFMARTRDWMILDGSLTKAAEDAFEAHVTLLAS